MSGRTAHILDKKWRSDDIRIEEDINFSSLLLPPKILKGLTSAGFKYPSPIQLKAIPVGKIGKDLVVQAKSGTGKTLVFTVVALNMLLEGATHPQVLIMAPTREIAFQICEVIGSVGASFKDFKCEYFIGGRVLEEDVERIQGCQVIVGTPGRIKHLINYKILKTAGIRLFVLDEADQLFKESSFTTDIDDIFRALPRDKQMIATSATYPEKLKRITDKYFRDPLLIRLNQNDIGLLGMVHYYRVIPVSRLPVVAYKEKLKLLENVLLSVKFAQCLVFCNMVSRVENLCVEIKNLGFATSFISSAREQEDRLKAIELLKKYKCKVLVSSDVSSRGIDAENVDLVINFDLPSQLETYFHRVGRAGRYGSKCASVSFITSDEIETYDRMQTNGRFRSYALPDCVPKDLISLQPKVKSNVNNEELLLDGSESSSDSSSDEEDLDENGVVKQKKANGFSEDKVLNGHSELSCTSKVDELASEVLTNPTEEKFTDSEATITESRKLHEIQNQFPDLNSNFTNSVKEDDGLSSSSESVELELDKIDSPASVELKQPAVVTKVSSSFEIVAGEEVKNLEVKKSNGEESCGNNELVERKLDQEISVTSVEDTTKNVNKSVTFKSNSSELQQISDTVSCLLDENNSKKLLKEKVIDGQSSIMNDECYTSKSFKDSKSKQMISSLITFVQEHEKCNKGPEEFSTANCAKSNEKSKNNYLSFESLKLHRLGLNQFHYDVCKNFIMKNSGDLMKEITEGCGNEKSVSEVSEIEKQMSLKLNDSENKNQNSSLDSKFKLFSTPKADLSDARSGNSSGESSSGSDKHKLIEHFNLKLASIQKVKPANENSTSESCSDSESNSDTSVNSEHAMYVLTKEFNRASQERAKCDKKVANIIYGTESSSSSSSDSDSGTSIDSDKTEEELEQKFNELMQSKRNDESSRKDREETKKLLQEIQSTKKCFKDIEIVDSKKHAEPSTSTSESDDVPANSNSSSSDSDTSLHWGKTNDESRKELNKRLQNMKNKFFNASKPLESYSYKTKTKNGLAENNISHSGTENDEDQYSKASSSGFQDRYPSKTCQQSESASKTDSGYRTKAHLPLKNKVTYSRKSSSETENDIGQCSKEPSSSQQIGHHRKRNYKKDKTRPTTKPSQFDYSNPYGTSNPYFNPASERPASHSYQEKQMPYLGSYSNYQTQPSYTSYPYYPSYSQQIQSHANDGQFLGTQSSHHIQPTYSFNPFSQPYPNECPLKESCQMNKMQSGCKNTISCSNSQRNSNPSTNHVQMQPSHPAYNQCFVPSQHLGHPSNETCQSPACAAWYDIFYKQWQFLNQSPYF